MSARDETSGLTSHVEVGPRLASIGRYVFEPSIFDALRATTPGKSGELQLTDGIARQARSEDTRAVRSRRSTPRHRQHRGIREANLRLAADSDAIAAPLRTTLREAVDELDRA